MRDLRVVCLVVALAAVGCPKSRVVGPRDDAATAPVDAAQEAADAASEASVDAAASRGDASNDAAASAVDASVDASTPDAALPPECMPGDVDCFGYAPRRCTPEGRWTPGEHCPDYCYRGQCVPCVPGVSVCWFSQIMRCSNDYVWQRCTGPDCGCSDFPRDCTIAGAECGMITDGLSGIAQCDPEIGGCPPGFQCGVGGVANRCDPAVAGATRECTPDTFDCGGSSRRRCSRTGKWLPLLPGEPCGTPSACLARGFNCGMIYDATVGNVDCGTCPAPYECGVVSANRCGLVP